MIGALHRAVSRSFPAAIPAWSATACSANSSYTCSGMTPMEAIRSATIVSARAMKLDRESGTVEAGKRRRPYPGGRRSTRRHRQSPQDVAGGYDRPAV